MPTYGYRCQSCDREFDVWQRMTDEPAASCPTCGGAGRRLFFPAGLVFKGSGFYVTDNRRGSSSNGSSQPEGTKAAPKTEGSQPAPKSDGSTSTSKAGSSAGSASTGSNE